MNEHIFISLYAIVHTQQYKENVQAIMKYHDFLKNVAMPYVSEDKTQLREDTPPSIKRQYTLFKKKMVQRFTHIQKLFEKFNVTRENLKHFENCQKYIGASRVSRDLLNLFYNFENQKFNGKIDARIIELGGIQNLTKRITVLLETELFS